MLFFSAMCAIAFINGSLTIDWVLSKPVYKFFKKLMTFWQVLSILGVFNAGMGILTAIGGGLLMGVPYNDIVAVMPFLVVGAALKLLNLSLSNRKITL